jgi:transglutaminase-like putative cysteine protease
VRGSGPKVRGSGPKVRGSDRRTSAPDRRILVVDPRTGPSHWTLALSHPRPIAPSSHRTARVQPRQVTTAIDFQYRYSEQVSVSFTFFRPLPRTVTRPIALLVLVAWAATMATLVARSYGQSSSANLATDLARYGSAAVWRGVYYRGEKIGFTVSQTTPTDDGFELQEDGRLQMLLLGQDTAARIRTTARVDTSFTLRSFDFSLDPGTGPVTVRGTVDGPSQTTTWRLNLAITSGGVTRTESRELLEPPVVSQNLSRLLANKRLVPGADHEWTVLDPATLQSAKVHIHVGDRGVVRANDTIVPAFRVGMDFNGLQTTSWVTDTGEVVREESPLGLITVREPAERAQRLSVPGRIQADLLQAAAVVPVATERIDEPRDVRRLKLRLEGAELSPDVDGVGQKLDGNVIELVDPRLLKAAAADPKATSFLAPEPLIESDDPLIRAEAEQAVRDAIGGRDRAERLTRYVNGLLDKKPTVGLPSAREVLRTKVGDCNEHTALFVAMARSIGIPARIAVGLVFMHGAFYYHAWPEVYVTESPGLGLWLAVDPTLNQFPADATHLRLARGGLDRQAAILPLIGRLKMTLLDLELAPGTDRVIVGRQPDPVTAAAALPLDLPRATTKGCRCDRANNQSTIRSTQ